MEFPLGPRIDGAELRPRAGSGRWPKVGYTASQDGALVGTHKVFVIFNPPRSGAERVAAPEDLRPILEKYGSKETSPLTVEIKKAVNNLEIKLD